MSAAQIVHEHIARSLGKSIMKVADAILKDPRIAVIELPAPEGPDDEGQEYFADGDIRVDLTGRRVSIFLDGHPLDVQAAEHLAAALLAAACKAREAGAK